MRARGRGHLLGWLIWLGGAGWGCTDHAAIATLEVSGQLPHMTMGSRPMGHLRGTVLGLDGDTFVAATGVRVAIGDREAFSDERGRFDFDGLTPGPLALTAAPPGFVPIAMTLKLAERADLDGVSVPLVPRAKLPAGQILVAGTVTDPRGAALASGQVHAVDSFGNGLEGGNVDLPLDAHGCFVWRLKGVPTDGLVGGTGSLTAYGKSPGGWPTETTRITQVSLAPGQVSAFVIAGEAAPIATPPRWDWLPPRGIKVTMADAPSRQYEASLVLEDRDRLERLWPVAGEEGALFFTVPEEWFFDPRRLQLDVLGSTSLLEMRSGGTPSPEPH